MELTTLSNAELLNRLEKLVRTERKITHIILCHINEVESRRLYADLGFDSMFRYLTSHCGYGEDSAYRRLQAARLLKNNPLISEKLEDGSLTLTQLTQVQKCIKHEIKSGHTLDSAHTLQILQQIENKSSYETKKVLAVEFNQPIQTHHVVTPQKDDSVRLEVTFSEEQFEELKNAKDLLSHIVPDGNWADVIAFLAQNYNKKFEGTKKRATEIAKTVSTPSFTTTRKRAHIKISVRRNLFAKANHCCEFIDLKTNRKCESTYQLQVDHKIPIAIGGQDNLENLRILCRSHNLSEAKRWGLLKL